MGRLILSLVLVLSLAAEASAHQGMIALYAEMEHTSCSMTLIPIQTANLYLFYERDAGPRIRAYEFKLLKSSSQAVFLAPTWPAEVVVTLGTVESGISLTTSACFPDAPYVPLGTIPIMNVADPDTFNVKVVADPTMLPPQGVAIIQCYPLKMLYVLGGTFVFNGECYSPEDPQPIAVEETTWGGIKELFK